MPPEKSESAVTIVNPLARPYSQMVTSEVNRGHAGVENVHRTGKQLGEAVNELGREIRVKQQLQRDIRSRPVCEA